MKNGTAAAYQSTYASLAKYIGKKEVKISQVNHRFVTCYRDFLSKNGATENTIGYYLRNFRALYNLAVKDAWFLHAIIRSRKYVPSPVKQ